MAPPALVEQFEIFRKGGASRGGGWPLNLINEFKLEAVKEAFGHRVVPAIAAPADAATEPMFGDPLLVIPAGVLAGVIRMVDQAVCHRPQPELKFAVDELLAIH